MIFNENIMFRNSTNSENNLWYMIISILFKMFAKDVIVEKMLIKISNVGNLFSLCAVDGGVDW